MADDEDRVERIERRLSSIEARLDRLEADELPEAAVDPAPQSVPTPAPVTPTSPPRRERPDLEARLGGNLLAKAGMAVLVLGVVFFLKYAFDHDWIGLSARIALGVVGGLALAATGDVLERRERFGVYPQVLVGGGAVIVTFSFFASWTFEDYRAATGMTVELASLMMGLTALGLALYAIGRRTPTLAAEALGLGALTTLFAESWEAFALVYLLVISAASLVAAIWREWSWVAFVSVPTTYVTLGVLLALDVPSTEVAWTAVGLLALQTLAVLRLTRGPEGPVTYATGTAALSMIGCWLVLVAAAALADNDDWQGPITAGLAVGSIALAAVPLAVGQARTGWAVSGLLLAAAWPPIQFDGTTIAVAWVGLLAAALVAFYVRPHDVTRIATLGFGALVVLRLIDHEIGLLDRGELHWLAGLALFGAVSVLFGVGWRIDGRDTDAESPTARLLLAGALLVPVLYLGNALQGRWISIAWAAEAFLVVVAGFALSIRDLRMAAIGLFGLVLARIFLYDLGALDPGVRIIAFLVVGALLLGASFLYARAAGRKVPDA